MSSDDNLRTSIYEDDGTAPAAWVHRNPTPEEWAVLEDELATEAGFLDYALEEEVMNRYAHYSTGEWEWDEYQRHFFNVGGNFIANKCRQSGGSAMLAAKFFARGALSDMDYTGILTSYKKEEAINKIDYVKRYLDALPPRFRKRIKRDPLQLIEFENPNGTIVKILSHAQKPIRGINGDIGLDELAFYQWDREIYASALPATAMVGGDINIISTPFGKSGVFYEVFADRDKYPNYSRLPIMWWYTRRYLKDPSDRGLIRAIKHAPGMSTQERVYTFGSPAIITQFEDASDLETFMQEFEGLFVDELAAFFTKDLILKVMYPEWSDIDDYNPVEADFDIPIEDALRNESYPLLNIYEGRKTIHGKKVHFKKYDSLEELYAAVRRGDVSRRLVAGVDIGTTIHSSHLTVLEEVQFHDGKTLQIERFSLSRQNWDLPDQNKYFKHVLQQGWIEKMYMDTTGIGMQMGQSLKKDFPMTFVPFQMGGSNSKQEMLMTNLKNRMEGLGIALAYERQTIEELYSIERVIGANKSVSFKAPEKQRRHADSAWAIALASHAGTPYGERALTGSAGGYNLGVSNEDFDNYSLKMFSEEAQSVPVGDVSLFPESHGDSLGVGEFNPGKMIHDYEF